MVLRKKKDPYRPNKADFREALGLTGAGGEEKSEKIRKRLRQMLDDHFDWQQPLASQKKQARDAVDADMMKFLPQSVLTPDRIKAMWGYMKVFYCNQHWFLKTKRRSRSMAASERRSMTAPTRRSMAASTRRSRCPTVPWRECDNDDDKDSDVDQPMDDETPANPAATPLPAGRAASDRSRPSSSGRTLCGSPEQTNRPAEQSLSVTSDADFLADLLVAHRELSDKHRELSDKLSRALEGRLRGIGKAGLV